jgi:hypothetical protein
MGNKKLKTMLHPPLQFDILNIESEKKELSGRGRACGRALCVLRQEILAESILAGTTVVAMGVRVSSMKKKAKAKEKEKAKPKSSRATKKAATTTTTTTTTTTSSSSTSSSSSTDKQAVDLAEVRKEISSIVGTNAAALTRAVMGEGLKGQLAPVKYLFEATGLYPATEISETKPDKESLAHTLMRNLKLPESPIVNEDDNEDDEDADSSNSSPAAAGAGQTNQPSGADSGTSADEKCSQGEEGTTAERAGDSVVE